MSSEDQKQDWLRLYAGFALLGLIAKNKIPSSGELEKEAFLIAERMIEQGKFND
jgi:hypothetical protein